MRAGGRSSVYAWYVVGLLWPAALLNYLDRVMITTMRDPIRADVGMTDAQFGLLTSVFLWVYAAVSPVGGYLADRFGRRWVILGSLAFWSVATWLSAYCRNFEDLLLARALMGFSEACYLPAALALIMDYHRGPTRSMATGLHMSGLYVGIILGGAGGYLAEHFGWRYGFQLFGAIGVVYALWLAATLRDAPQDAIELGRPADAGPRVTWASIGQQLLGLPAFWLLLVLNVLVGVSNWVVLGWLPTYLREHFDLSLGAAGLSATAYVQVAALAGVILGGLAADAWSRGGRHSRCLVPALGYLVAGPCLLLAANTNHLPVALASLVLFGLGRGCYDANLMPILRDTADERFSATGYGFLNFTSTAVGGMMVYAGGLLNDEGVGLRAVFQACGIGLVFVGMLLLAMKKRPASSRPH